MIIKKAGKIIKSFFITSVIIVILTAVFFAFTGDYFFKTENIIINGIDMYSYDEILDASEIIFGGGLIGADSGKAKKNIKDTFKYVETVKIKKTLPSTVTIEIKTGAKLFGIMLDGDYYVITDNFFVAEKIKVRSAQISAFDFKAPEGIITIEANAVRKCRTGDKILFSDADVYDFLNEIALLHKNDENINSIACITGIDIRNKFKVTMNYGDKFLVRLGIFENISMRVLNSFEVIEQLPPYAKGIIDMTDGKAASFTPDGNIPEIYKSGSHITG